MTDLSNNTPNKDTLIMDQVQEDMDVQDANGDNLGEVDYIHFGEGHDAAGVSEAATDNRDAVSDLLADVFSSPDDMPEELRQRLFRHGFARVDANTPGKLHYFMPEQIERIDDDTVYLNVSQDELVSS